MAKFTSRQIIALLKTISERKIGVGNKQGERSVCSRGTTTDFGDSSLKFRQISDRYFPIKTQHEQFESCHVSLQSGLIYSDEFYLVRLYSERFELVRIWLSSSYFGRTQTVWSNSAQLGLIRNWFCLSAKLSKTVLDSSTGESRG